MRQIIFLMVIAAFGGNRLSAVPAKTGASVATLIGTVTKTGKARKSWHIDDTVTRADINYRKLKLWFTAGDQKMVPHRQTATPFSHAS